ncbi:erythromycin esterase family protein [Embleya sp. NPDC056575]|uniref:erythromycin esterase family protein n=1 Tax=unclassified Embleya TaxID=2699296 RepID=UPI0036761BCD
MNSHRLSLVCGPAVVSATPPAPAPSRGDPARALAAQAFPLRSTVPGGPDTDLAAFGTMLRDAEVVGAGAATHGSGEFGTVRHRLFRYLVDHHGFRGLVLGIHPRAGARLDAWVRHGTGHLKTIMDEEFRADDSPWNTLETLDVFRWMRLWNVRGAPGAVRVLGIGSELSGADRAAAAADGVIRWQRRIGAGVFVFAHNREVAAGSGAGDEPPNAGRALRERLGDRYANVGFTFGQGSFGAVDATAPGRPRRRFDLGPTGPGAAEFVLGRVCRRDWYLDTRTIAPGLARDWLADAHPTRGVGLVWPCDEYTNTRLRPTYDILVHLHHVGAAHHR